MTIEIKPLTIHTGAEISGVDLNQPISDSDATDIWDAFLKWKVVFFRDQPMSHADQVTFGRRFGELTIGHAVFGHVDGYPEIYSIAKDRWDNRYKPAPKNIRPWTEYKAMQERRRLTTEHPMVRVHPETGERVLYISPSFLKSVVGMEPRESELILEMLWEHSVRPEFTLRYKWEPNDLAMWDNRAVVHCAPRDIYETDFDRQLYRITMLGDIPVGVDGRQSVSISGEPITPITAAAAE